MDDCLPILTRENAMSSTAGYDLNRTYRQRATDFLDQVAAEVACHLDDRQAPELQVDIVPDIDAVLMIATALGEEVDRLTIASAGRTWSNRIAQAMNSAAVSHPAVRQVKIDELCGTCGGIVGAMPQDCTECEEYHRNSGN